MLGPSSPWGERGGGAWYGSFRWNAADVGACERDKVDGAVCLVLVSGVRRPPAWPRAVTRVRVVVSRLKNRLSHREILEY